MAKTKDTLVEDIYSVFTSGAKPSPEDLTSFGEDLKKVMVDAVTPRNGSYLRVSNLGTPCRRKLWYSVNASELAEPLSGPARIKFLIGHVTEAVVLFLAKLAGHKVERQQEEVEINGVKGHLDAFIDGELFDVKSTSPYSFDKFKDGLTPEQDAFGYLDQISAYGAATGEKTGSFLAVHKVLGTLAVDTHVLKQDDYDAKVKQAQDMLAQNEPPERTFDPVPEGKSGNMKLATPCTYCDFHRICYPGAKPYRYAKGTVWLTRVAKEPRVDPQ